jgi:hypothetical protein
MEGFVFNVVIMLGMLAEYNSVKVIYAWEEALSSYFVERCTPPPVLPADIYLGSSSMYARQECIEATSWCRCRGLRNAIVLYLIILMAINHLSQHKRSKVYESILLHHRCTVKISHSQMSLFCLNFGFSQIRHHIFEGCSAKVLP